MKKEFKITGMTCAACSARVEKVTRAVKGVQSAEVNLLAGTMVADVDKEEIVKKLAAIDYQYDAEKNQFLNSYKLKN